MGKLFPSVEVGYRIEGFIEYKGIEGTEFPILLKIIWMFQPESDLAASGEFSSLKSVI